jgi:hypothetical protein
MQLSNWNNGNYWDFLNFEGKTHQRQCSETEVLTVEQCQRSSASDASVAIETNLQSDLDDVGKELDLRQEKKLK